tara:strand:+ start:867 stop:1175 length:309 start_codon:yes stop_codon:yes gene_type:complete
MAEVRVNLYETKDSGIQEIMDGPWKSITVEDIAPGETFHLDGRVDEHCFFTISGTGHVTEPDGRSWDFTKGNTISLPQGGQAFITGGDEGMKALIITMTVGH